MDVHKIMHTHAHLQNNGKIDVEVTEKVEQIGRYIHKRT